MNVSCNARNIYCPKCRRKVGNHDGKSTVVKQIDCRKCWKTVVFDPTTGDAKIKERPARTSSSGVTFR